MKSAGAAEAGGGGVEAFDNGTEASADDVKRESETADKPSTN